MDGSTVMHISDYQCWSILQIPMAASSANILALVLAAPEAVAPQLEPVHAGAWTALTVGITKLA
jgi:hypothetical protein